MNLTRRVFLQAGAGLALSMGVVPKWALASPGEPEPALAPAAKGRTLVVVWLRGGTDGLSLVVPYGDDHYYRHRKSLAIPAPGREGGCLDLDGYFGLNPRLEKLHSLFNAGQMVALQAIGYSGNTRSHFEEQDTWETAVSTDTLKAHGWINRHLATTSSDAPVRAVAIGSTLPRIMRGEAQTFAVASVNDLKMPDSLPNHDAALDALTSAYIDSDASDEQRELLNESGRATVAMIKRLKLLIGSEYKSSVAYPNTGLGRDLREVARLIKSNIGMEIAEVELNGWDTHLNQGTTQQGGLPNLAQQLGDALAAFWEDLGDQGENTLIVTQSEFGRTVRENGTTGTDHGWGSVMFALGGPIAAGIENRPTTATGAALAGAPVIGTWPGLAPEQLKDNRDLAHTTEFRDVIAELTGTWLKNPNTASVLPGHTVKKAGLLT